jgi:hypothetical protein
MLQLHGNDLETYLTNIEDNQWCFILHTEWTPT